MKNFNSYIGDGSDENVIFNAEKKIVIPLYNKNGSSSLLSTFGNRREWTVGVLKTCKEDFSDYTIINCIRDPITRAISAMSQTLRVIKKDYGYFCGDDGRNFSLENVLDIHFRPQCCYVLTPYINDLDLSFSTYFDTSGKTWNTFLEEYGIEQNIYSQVENPNQVWFLVSPHTDIVLDIARYLNYNIGNYTRKSTKNNIMDFENPDNIDVLVTKSFIDYLEKTYKYDMLLFSKVKFENV